MAHKKGAGSTKNGRDSESKRLGIKVYAKHQVNKGTIIVRQRGLTLRPGIGVRVGKDFTIFASVVGVIRFTSKKNIKFVSILTDGNFLRYYILEYVRNKKRISFHSKKIFYDANCLSSCFFLIFRLYS
jgi:large subunit ribosomal protein L27